MERRKSIDDIVSLNQNVLYRSDCKEALKRLIDKGIRVDLIYLDPPFNSNRIYNLIYRNKGKTAQQKAFSDMWTYSSQTEQMLLQFKDTLEGSRDISELVKNFLRTWIESLQNMSSKDQKMLAYLIYMAERLLWMKKILKDTGSIYYHCDPTASHYIKIIMDGIFGYENLRNEIVWAYHGPGSPGQKQFSRKHDIIFWYSQGLQWCFNSDNIRVPYKDPKQTLRRIYSTSGSFTEEEAKEYRERGKIPEDWWEIRIAPRSKREYLGYPTQKPLALLDRIIRASSKKGDLVLDPFCGCGTTLEASAKLNRKWLGIDISPTAVEIIKDRLSDRCPGQKYIELDGSPESRIAYDRLDPFQKQDFLIRKIGGFPNPKKSGDQGVDGELTMHLGTDEKNQDQWGKMIFSVKTGKQSKPEFVRELIGTMQITKSAMGGLILEADPSPRMEEAAEKQKKLSYIFKKDIPPMQYDRVQILTAQEIIDGETFDTPPTLEEIKLFRKQPSLFA